MSARPLLHDQELFFGYLLVRGEILRHLLVVDLIWQEQIQRD